MPSLNTKKKLGRKRQTQYSMHLHQSPMSAPCDPNWSVIVLCIN